METILVYNLRTIFFPGIQSHKIIWSIMEHHLKQKKTMLPSLKCQIFCFRSKFVSFTQLCRQQIQFSKIRLCHFLVYGKMASYKELKFTEKILRKMRHGWTDRQTNGQTNRTDFIRPLSQRRRFDHFFWNFENKIFWNYLAWLWAIWKESILDKGIQWTYFSVQKV